MRHRCPASACSLAAPACLHALICVPMVLGAILKRLWICGQRVFCAVPLTPDAYAAAAVAFAAAAAASIAAATAASESASEPTLGDAANSGAGSGRNRIKLAFAKSPVFVDIKNSEYVIIFTTECTRIL
jgi:hypothetical protein